MPTDIMWNLTDIDGPTADLICTIYLNAFAKTHRVCQLKTLYGVDDGYRVDQPLLPIPETSASTDPTAHRLDAFHLERTAANPNARRIVVHGAR